MSEADIAAGLPKGWQPYASVHGTDHTVVGNVCVWPTLDSPAELGAREIVAYLPPSYGHEDASSRRYPVLYFHDGQNVFDERTSYVGKWAADETLEALSKEGIEAIAVAVPNRGAERMDEYNPWREPSRFTSGRLSGGKGDAYMEWLAGTVKPLVDRSFPTLTQREATGLAGSSMGGLISLYGLVAQPQVFGLSLAMSPSIMWHDYGIVQLIEQGRMPAARIHVDMGGREWRGGLADGRRLRDALVGAGFVEGRDLNYVEERFAPHNETAWARRLPDALRFLLAPFRR